LLTAQDLLANPSLAAKYGVKGLLIVTAQQGGPLSLNAKPGQLVEIPLALTFKSFSADVPSVRITFAPVAGQLMQGDIDVSSMESYSASEITVGAEPVIVVLTVHLPINLDQGSFPVVPTGLNLSPSTGTGIFYDTQLHVSVSS